MLGGVVGLDWALSQATALPVIPLVMLQHQSVGLNIFINSDLVI